MIATAKIWCWLCAGSVVALLAGAAPPDLVPDSLRVPPRVVPAAKTVLLAEDFKNLDAWQSDREGAWSVEQGVLCAHLPDEKQEHALLYAGSESWGDYAPRAGVEGLLQPVLAPMNMTLMPLARLAMIRDPIMAPPTVPEPPRVEVPPRMQLAMASSS